MPSWLKTSITVILTLIFSWNTFGPGSQEDPIPEDIEFETQPTYSYSFCSYCDSEVPEEFMYTDDGDYVCPDCVYGAIDYFISGPCGICYNCNSWYETKFSSGYGLCEDCGFELLSECMFCFEYTYEWTGCDWFSACPKCLSNAYKNSDLEALLLKYFESE